MSFLVICQPSLLSNFKKKKDFAGGIYIRQPDQDFLFPITDIPKNIDTIYFHYDEGNFAYVMNNSKYLKHLRVLPFFDGDSKITIGLSVLLEEGMNLLNEGNVNLASTLLLRSKALAELSRDSDIQKQTKDAYLEKLPKKIISIGKDFLSQNLLSQAAYFFRQALLIVPSNNEVDQLLKETNSKIQETLVNETDLNHRDLSDGEPVTLSNLRNITKEEFEIAKTTCKIFGEMVKERNSFSTEIKLDKKIALPSNYWSGKINNILLSPDYDIINHLRLHSYVFTGMKLRDHINTSPSPLPEKLVNQFKKLTSGLPHELIASPPAIMGEIGWRWEKGILNPDVVAYQERLALINKSGLYKELMNKEQPIILEIGSGYGALAYFLKEAIPHARMILCDLPESLAIAAVYLKIAFPNKTHFIYEGIEVSDDNKFDFTYIPNLYFNQKSIKNIDLAINTLSFAEMTIEQVQNYVNSIKASIGAEGYMFEQNQDKRVIVSDIISNCGLKQIFTERGQQGVANVWKNP